MVSKWKALTCCSPLCTSFRRGGQLLPTLLFNNFWKFQAHSFNFSAREREDAQEWIIRSQKVFDFSIFQFTFQLPFLLAPDFYQLQLIEDCVWPASKTISAMQQIASIGTTEVNHLESVGFFCKAFFFIFCLLVVWIYEGLFTNVSHPLYCAQGPYLLIYCCSMLRGAWNFMIFQWTACPVLLSAAYNQHLPKFPL